MADPIQGTFQAVVNASIEQVEAYADLLADVTTTVDENSDPPERQQFLATMVLMGINRIVVVDGSIRARLPC